MNYFTGEEDYSVHDGATMFSICSYVAETDEAINLVEGERVYVIGILTISNMNSSIDL